MYRISVTTLEKFRRYMTEASSFDTEAALLESIKGTFTGNPKTHFGGAYHKIIEGDYVQDKITGVVNAGGFLFTREQAEPALQYRSARPHMAHEVEAKKIYPANFFPIQVGAKVDVLDGLFIRDAKTKFRNPDFQEYIDSCQWKFYLDMMEAEAFYYDVFEVKKFKDEGWNEGQLFPDVTITAHEQLECLRYANMEKDVLCLLNDFLDYVANRNLFGYLKPATEFEPLFF